MSSNEGFNYKQISASGLISNAPCNVGGLFCSSAGGGTATLYDSQSASGNIIAGPFNLADGTPYPLPACTSVGLYVALTGTPVLTVFWQ